MSDDPTQDGVVVRTSGRRCADPALHDGGVYRDWVEVILDEGVLRVEPSLGRIALTYGTEETEPLQFSRGRSLYDNMFRALNMEFVRCALDPTRPEPLSRQARLLGTAAAILMQQPNFNGEITEQAVRQLQARPGHWARFKNLIRL